MNDDEFVYLPRPEGFVMSFRAVQMYALAYFVRIYDSLEDCIYPFDPDDEWTDAAPPAIGPERMN